MYDPPAFGHLQHRAATAAPNGKPLPSDICTVHAVNVLDTYELQHGQCGIPD
jgi:hypothetical protein